LIKTPTLLVIGQEDRTTLGRGTVSEEVLRTLGQYPQLGKEAARDIPGSRLVELKKSATCRTSKPPRGFIKRCWTF